MLFQILNYIAREKRVSMQQLTRYFHIEKEAILPILSIWIKKGVIFAVGNNTSCKTCLTCNPQKMSYYEYRPLDKVSHG